MVKKETPTQVFSCEFCQIFSEQGFFIKQLQTTASGITEAAVGKALEISEEFWGTIDREIRFR